MDVRGTNREDEAALAETPEDAAVLYSWANLHGAKYRDFSASRREYRAELRHRAAEQLREQALLAQTESEQAAKAAEEMAYQAIEATRTRRPDQTDSSVERSVRTAEEASRVAAAERVEAARRAETAAVAEAAARREEREIAEAHAFAKKEAARYRGLDVHHGTIAEGQPNEFETPGQVSDPYTIYSNAHLRGSSAVTSKLQMGMVPTMQPADRTPQDSMPSERERADNQQGGEISASSQTDRRTATSSQGGPWRPQGYRPDDASGVRQIYRGPDYGTQPVDDQAGDPVRPYASEQNRFAASAPGRNWRHDMKSIGEPSVSFVHAPPDTTSDVSGREERVASFGQRRTDSPLVSARSSQVEASPSISTGGPSSENTTLGSEDRSEALSREQAPNAHNVIPPEIRGTAVPIQPATPTQTTRLEAGPISLFSQAMASPDSARDRRAHENATSQQPPAGVASSRRGAVEPPLEAAAPVLRPGNSPDPVGPAWLYAPATSPASQRPVAQPSVGETLQQSRERVAARWYALKGVFEQPGQEREVAPVRQKETRTPVLAVFSLAGGVGKTSLVATVGRSLSSMGEKVLLTDTTSHGLLPFYFGASELRQGTVRTFSPPSGSTDAPIYLVSHDVEQRAGDEDAQGQLAEEIISNSRGTHRILLDLTVRSSWLVGKMSRLNPTILVPVAPDMNSVISLQAIEKFFNGVSDGDGRPLQPYYVLNQFDPSLPLHLDVREVMRRQLGDRLLSFVIRRAPAVSEALAEGMTVVDYAPDAAVAEDYMNLATWLRTVAAPATAGFRNVRWSER